MKFADCGTIQHKLACKVQKMLSCPNLPSTCTGQYMPSGFAVAVNYIEVVVISKWNSTLIVDVISFTGFLIDRKLMSRYAYQCHALSM